MGAVLAVVNQKGGAGKTTLALNLAGILAGPRRRVALVDADPQRSAFNWGLSRKGDLAFPVHFLDARLGTARFRDKLKALAKDVEVLIIDTPPKLAQATLLSSLLADLLLIPVPTSIFDYWGAKETLGMLAEVRTRRENGLPGALLVPSKIRPGTKLAREFPKKLALMGEKVAPSVAERVAVVDAMGAGKTINQLNSAEAAIKEYKELAVFVLKILRDQSSN
ncbi:ParA family protein [Dethiosulfatarculus sandiegensis]|uniref:Cobyrinic acid a,c-diamide synthase n=1 Tax=Dethiosulfatarculus sandiegensis TaxID=1429043 RepID=A0A0D2J4S6_9BACT|nr:ParA family protein [Dethiosulfatarculus sandiegensis]KIX10726.1 cobyrinic acid a,c-diamide synthase [Dethiosulfatarculus sandiegensis]